jgi:agmatine/peptidylarginine deiminase
MRTISETAWVEARRALAFRRATLREYVSQAEQKPAYPGEKQNWEEKLAAVEAAFRELDRA